MGAVGTRPRASGRGRRRRPGEPRLGLAAAAILGLVALAIAWDAGVKSAAAVPDAARALGAALVLFTAAGYAPTRLLAPRALGPHFAFVVPCVGAAVSALGLTLLGFLHVPIEASLAAVIAAGAGGGLWLRARRGPARAATADLGPAGGTAKRLLWPAFIVALILSITLIPMWRAGFATTTGQNGDAVLAVGVADFLKETPPRRRGHLALRGPDARQLALEVPDLLRAGRRLGAVGPGDDEGAGADDVAPARRARGWASSCSPTTCSGWERRGALLVMGLVPFNRILVYLVVQPFYNQIWGEFALAFILLFGFWFLREPRRGTAALALPVHHRRRCSPTR